MTETLLVVIAILLAVICIVGVGILFNVSQTKIAVSSFSHLVATLHDIKANQLKDQFELTTSQLEQLVENSNSTDRKISDIQQVTDVIYRYKLPSARERKMLDQIEIDNEVSDGIFNAGRQQPL